MKHIFIVLFSMFFFSDTLNSVLKCLFFLKVVF